MVTARLSAEDDEVLLAIRGAFGETARPVVLAVSGGLDSMVLLDAAARVARHRVAAVASFDHLSGDHSARAVRLVRQEAAARGLPVVIGQARAPLHGEAAWRAARWAFLARTAIEAGADIATAHTLDDQLETVCMRVLRGAGARGLAALLAPSATKRPFLGLHRNDLKAYAHARGVPHIEDPTNASRAYLRNRVRHDLLPAIARVDRTFGSEMLALAREAARLRHAVDEVAAMLAEPGNRNAVSVDLSTLRRMTGDALRVLGPSLAARAGIILDRRGTTRLSAFILEGRVGGRVQLSGGAEALLTRRMLVIRKERAVQGSGDELPLDVVHITGGWRFRHVRNASAADTWTAELPAESRLTVRPWRAGDRMRAAGAVAARRVKRFFSDAGIAGPDRIGWPVVLADGEIVWIPGVRRSDAATDRSGRPVLRYRCERNDV
jgi:tRNA(Ile)-lysidine synthase